MAKWSTRTDSGEFNIAYTKNADGSTAWRFAAIQCVILADIPSRVARSEPFVALPQCPRHSEHPSPDRHEHQEGKTQEKGLAPQVSPSLLWLSNRRTETSTVTTSLTPLKATTYQIAAATQSAETGSSIDRARVERIEEFGNVDDAAWGSTVVCLSA